MGRKDIETVAKQFNRYKEISIIKTKTRKNQTKLKYHQISTDIFNSYLNNKNNSNKFKKF